MDAETLTSGKKRLKTCTGRKKDVAFEGTLADLDPGDLSFPTWTLAFEGPRRHPKLGFHLGRHL
jgi:hypothetical protein